ncbi:hypothetical protein AAFP35_21875 [Gordonia sp. CPCC 206044]|uniref:hypothetical protein n=1 Tax=Gordonia sp. CPCC 206044 TaxID=3140793 RepID=UPI003AF3EFF3
MTFGHPSGPQTPGEQTPPGTDHVWAPSSEPTQPAGIVPAAAGAPPAPRPQLWLRSGPMLPQRTWQRSTRSPIIVITAVAALLLATIAVLALVVGAVNRASFTASGVVVCPTDPALALRIGPGAPVTVFDETGTELAETTLGQRRPVGAGGCEMPFTADSVTSGRPGYVVRIADVFQETVSQSALIEGAVLRPVG